MLHWEVFGHLLGVRVESTVHAWLFKFGSLLFLIPQERTALIKKGVRLRAYGVGFRDLDFALPRCGRRGHDVHVRADRQRQDAHDDGHPGSSGFRVATV